MITLQDNLAELLSITSKGDRFYKLNFIINNGKYGAIEPTNLVVIKDLEEIREQEMVEGYTPKFVSAMSITRDVFPLYLTKGSCVDDIRNRKKHCVNLRDIVVGGQLVLDSVTGKAEGGVESDHYYISRLWEMSK